MTRLQNGQQFPQLTVPAVGGGTLDLPGDLAGNHGVVLIYRGSWCPYCTAQLGSFSRKSEALADLGVKVIALSADSEAEAEALADKHNLAFPVGHSADVATVSAATGAHVDDSQSFLQSTGFVLAPDGTILTAVYSTGAIGRLTVDDVLGFVRYVKTAAA